LPYFLPVAMTLARDAYSILFRIPRIPGMRQLIYPLLSNSAPRRGFSSLRTLSTAWGAVSRGPPAYGIDTVGGVREVMFGDMGAYMRSIEAPPGSFVRDDLIPRLSIRELELLLAVCSGDVVCSQLLCCGDRRRLVGLARDSFADREASRASRAYGELAALVHQSAGAGKTVRPGKVSAAGGAPTQKAEVAIATGNDADLEAKTEGLPDWLPRPCGDYLLTCILSRSPLAERLPAFRGDVLLTRGWLQSLAWAQRVMAIGGDSWTEEGDEEAFQAFRELADPYAAKWYRHWVPGVVAPGSTAPESSPDIRTLATRAMSVYKELQLRLFEIQILAVLGLAFDTLSNTLMRGAGFTPLSLADPSAFSKLAAGMPDQERLYVAPDAAYSNRDFVLNPSCTKRCAEAFGEALYGDGLAADPQGEKRAQDPRKAKKDLLVRVQERRAQNFLASCCPDCLEAFTLDILRPLALSCFAGWKGYLSAMVKSLLSSACAEDVLAVLCSSGIISREFLTKAAQQEYVIFLAAMEGGAPPTESLAEEAAGTAAGLAGEAGQTKQRRRTNRRGSRTRGGELPGAAATPGATPASQGGNGNASRQGSATAPFSGLKQPKISSQACYVTVSSGGVEEHFMTRMRAVAEGIRAASLLLWRVKLLTSYDVDYVAEADPGVFAEAQTAIAHTQLCTLFSALQGWGESGSGLSREPGRRGIRVLLHASDGSVLRELAAAPGPGQIDEVCKSWAYATVVGVPGV